MPAERLHSTDPEAAWNDRLGRRAGKSPTSAPPKRLGGGFPWCPSRAEVLRTIGGNVGY